MNEQPFAPFSVKMDRRSNTTLSSEQIFFSSESRGLDETFRSLPTHIPSAQLNPRQAIEAQICNLHPGTQLIATVPNEDFLDQLTIDQVCNPSSAKNEGATSEDSTPKWTFTIHKPVASSHSSRSINLLDLLKSFSHEVSIESIDLISESEAKKISSREDHDAVTKIIGGLAGDTQDQVNLSDDKTHIRFVLRKHLKPLPHIAMPTRKDLIARVLRLYATKEYASILEIVDSYSWITSQSADILNAAGASAFALKSPDRALEFYRSAIVQMPGHYDAWNNLGIALFDGGKLKEAEEAHRKAIELMPTQVSFKGDLVKILIRTHQFAEAISICQYELQANPKALFFLGELGSIYTRQGRLTEARGLYDQILKLQPDTEHVALNCGVRLFQAGFHDESEAIYRDAISRYQSEMARFHLSLLLLTKGRFAEGWQTYEARATVRKSELPEYQYPLWKGEPIAGKSLLLSYEQGYGDEVMISRYVSTLKEAGATRVGLICRRPMVPLLKTLKDVDILTPEEGTVVTLKDGEFDYWTLPFDVPRYLQTDLHNLPVQVPYLQSLPERRESWAEKINPHFGKAPEVNRPFRVGLVWKGSTLHVADSERSLSHLEQLAPLWQVPGVEFISLQKGQGEAEAKSPPSNQPILDLGSTMDDFADLAAIVDQLDLVIAVDTAVVHVAGALNIPCWVMIPYFATDWRWMLGRDDSPWYPSLRLFRQDASGNWAKTIKDLQEALSMKANQQVIEMDKLGASA